MAARYATVSFCFYNTSTGADEYVSVGALRDSTSDAAVQYPEMFGTAPLTASDGLPPPLVAWLQLYPAG